MYEKIADSIENAGEKPVQPVLRLCNEIQLFDLCELEKCSHKQCLYCTSTELLNRFEAIADEDERRPVAGLITDELDDGAEPDDEFDDAFDDEFGDEEYEEDE